jgi:transcriptional regulator GlxA family with amidase domain
VEALAVGLHLSRSQVFRKVKALTGETPVTLLRNYRLARARTLLEQGGRTVSEVAFACGFNSASYFSDVYLSVYGRRPSEHAKA